MLKENILTVQSAVRGFHVCKVIWQPEEVEKIMFGHEENNDLFAIKAAGAKRRFQVPGARSQVSGSRCQVPGARCQASGARGQLPGPRLQVSGVRFQIPRTRYV